MSRVTITAVRMMQPVTSVVSRWLTPSMTSRPTPGQEKTFSVTTAPPRALPISVPTTVMMGIRMSTPIITMLGSSQM